MELLVKRNPTKNKTTLGNFFVDGVRECFSLEDEVREIPGQPVSAWKIDRVTAIPRGRYQVIINMSTRFKKLLPLLIDVPGFKGVRIHGGNTHENTEGCILVGNSVTGDTITGGTSQPALQKLQAKIQAALDKGEKVWITIQ